MHNKYTGNEYTKDVNINESEEEGSNETNRMSRSVRNRTVSFTSDTINNEYLNRRKSKF